MKAIVAVDENWGIGLNNKLLFHFPKDMKFFKALTTGKVVVMGRETFLSLPNQQPLTGRTNVVLTTDQNFKRDGVIVCHRIEDVIELLVDYKSDDIFIIGGASVYEQMLHLCSDVYVTKVKATKDADRLFPNLDNLEHWALKEVLTVADDVYEGEQYQLIFCHYINETCK